MAHSQEASPGQDFRGPELCEKNFLHLPVHVYSKRFLWENDIGFTDEDYTNGMKWERHLYDECSDYFGGIGDLVEGASGMFSRASNWDQGTQSSSLGYSFGMNMYTPRRTDVSSFIPEDRPYSGWAYVSVFNVVRSPMTLQGGRQARFEIMLGALGEWAHQEELQTAWHQLIDASLPQGWDNQQEGRVGLNATYETDRYYFSQGTSGRVRYSTGYGALVGNVRTEVRGRLGIAYTRKRETWLVYDPAIIIPANSIALGLQNLITPLEQSETTDESAAPFRDETNSMAREAFKQHSFWVVGMTFEPRAKLYDAFLDENSQTGDQTYSTKDFVADLVLSVDFKFRGSRSIFAFRRIERSAEISSSLGRRHTFLQFMWQSYFH